MADDWSIAARMPSRLLGIPIHRIGDLDRDRLIALLDLDEDDYLVPTEDGRAALIVSADTIDSWRRS